MTFFEEPEPEEAKAVEVFINVNEFSFRDDLEIQTIEKQIVKDLTKDHAKVPVKFTQEIRNLADIKKLREDNTDPAQTGQLETRPKNRLLAKIILKPVNDWTLYESLLWLKEGVKLPKYS